MTVLKIDIPVLTDLDSHILKSLKGLGSLKLGWMHVPLIFMRSSVGSSSPATFFCEDGSRNHFYGHSLPSTDSSRAVVSYWQKDVHIILVTCLACLGLSLSRKSVV